MFGNVRRRLLSIALCAVSLAFAPPSAAQIGPDLDVPYVTTPDHVVNAMLSLAGVTAQDFVLDLGSGDGRIVISAATKFGARGMGVEIDPALVLLSNESARKAGVAERARFVEQDLFATDLGQASVITLYLLPDVNLKLRPELLKLRPGTRIVSHDWDMGDWQPDGKVVLEVPEKKLGLEKKSTLLLWKVPAVVEGTWSSAKRLRLKLRQRYQMLDGAVTYRGQTYTDASGRVDGTRMHLCFTHYDTGRCRLGAMGQLTGGDLRLLIDGAGRQQITVIAHKDSARQGKQRHHLRLMQ
jgi:hypothetical protein